MYLAKRGTWGPELQRDRSSKESKHLLIQLPVSHWDVLRGLITTVGSQQSLLWTDFTDRLEGCSVLSCRVCSPRLGTALALGEQASYETSPKRTLGTSSHASREGWAQPGCLLHMQDLLPETIRLHAQGFCAQVCTLLHPAAHFWAASRSQLEEGFGGH